MSKHNKISIEKKKEKCAPITTPKTQHNTTLDFNSLPPWPGSPVPCDSARTRAGPSRPARPPPPQCPRRAPIITSPIHKSIDQSIRVLRVRVRVFIYTC